MRTLTPGGDVRFSLTAVPLDELMITVHETRFSGELSIGLESELDRITFQRGWVHAVEPPAAVKMRLMVDGLKDSGLVEAKVLRAQIEADPRLTGDDIADCFVFRGLISESQVQSVKVDVARRRLFELYDRGPQPVLLKRGEDNPDVSREHAVNPLPAAAYGLVSCASDARRRAMLAYAAHKRVELQYGYDLERNRYGLPPPLLEVVRSLAEQGASFGRTPKLPGIDEDSTAGLLLLFRRMGLVRFREVTRPPGANEARGFGSLDAAHERTDRFSRAFVRHHLRDAG